MLEILDSQHIPLSLIEMPRKTKRSRYGSRSSRKRTRKPRYNHHGGEDIGAGSYGCVYSPSIPCGNSSNDRANAFRGLSSNNYVTKLTSVQTASDEKEKGTQLRIALETTALAPNNVLIGPSAICGLPADLTEKQKEDLAKCSVKMADPYLVQLKNGGTSLDKFKCPEADRGLFMTSLVELFDKLRILHAQNIAHLDIKPANIVTQRLENGSYLTRFVDIGFMLDIGAFDEADETLFAFKNDYIIWPFEARYLAEAIVDPMLYEINNFYAKCAEKLPLIGIPNKLYYDSFDAKGGRRIFDNPAFIAKFKKFLRDPTGERKIDVIAKAVDVYSLGYTLALLYRKTFGHAFLNHGIYVPVQDEFNRKLYTEVSAPMYNLVLHMMNPDTEDRYTIEESAAELNGIVGKLNVILGI